MKKIIVFICLILLTGCTATYEINIKDDKITEKLTAIETNQLIFDDRNDSGWTIRDMFDATVNSIDDRFSNKNGKIKSINSDDKLGIEYTNTINSIENSSILNQCYINPRVTVNGSEVTLDTGFNFKCYEYYENLETIKIVLKTNYKVISTNADEESNGKYIWNFTKDSNKQIKFTYDKSVTNNSTNMYLIIIVIFVIIIVGITGYVIIRKNKNSNKF